MSTSNIINMKQKNRHYELMVRTMIVLLLVNEQAYKSTSDQSLLELSYLICVENSFQNITP